MYQTAGVEKFRAVLEGLGSTQPSAFGTVVYATAVSGSSWEEMKLSSSINYRNSYPNVDRLFFWKTLWLHLHISFLFTA